MEHRKEYSLKLLGRNLKSLRKAKGYTVEEIREYLCLGSAQAIYKYENGRGYPKADSLLALMELYGAGARDLSLETDDVSGMAFSAASSDARMPYYYLYGMLLPCFRGRGKIF